MHILSCRKEPCTWLVSCWHRPTIAPKSSQLKKLYPVHMPSQIEKHQRRLTYLFLEPSTELCFWTKSEMNLRCFCNIIYSTVSSVKTIYFTTTMCCRSILGQNPEEEKVAENTGRRNKTWKIGKTSILCSLFHAEHHHGLLWSGKELKETEKTVPIKYNQEQGE